MHHFFASLGGIDQKIPTTDTEKGDKLIEFQASGEELKEIRTQKFLS